MTDTSVMQDRIGQLCGQQAAHHGRTAAGPMPWQLSWRYWSRKLRIAATGASTGCAGSPRARPGKPSTTESPWRCGSLDQLAQGSFVERGINVLAFGLPGTGRPTPCAPWATAATPSSSLRPTVWYRNCSPPSAIWTCPASCATGPSTSCSSTTWAQGASRRSSSPSESAGRWASRQTWSSPSGSASLPIPWPGGPGRAPLRHPGV